MTSPNSRRVLPRTLLAAGAVALATGLALVGCSGEEQVAPVAATPPPPPPPPPAPAKPAVTSVAQLMIDLSIDERVVLPEDKAPDNTPDRIAVLEFFDAFVRGDSKSLGIMMSDLDRTELDAVSETEGWKATIAAIDEVTLDTGPGPNGEKCALALFDVDGSFQPQLWYFDGRDSGYQFDAAASPPGVMDQLYGDNWIARWHELLEGEIALANQLDVDVERQQTNLQDESAPGSDEPRLGGSSPGGNPLSPGGGGRRPKPPKRAPPGGTK